MNRQTLVRRLADASGLIDAAIRLTRSRIRILMYHGVSPHTLDPALFREQLAYVGRRFDSFWVSEVPALLDGRIRPRRPPIVITFDDGLRNFWEHAAPALHDHRIKGTVYVVSDLLDGRSMLWNHEVQCRLMLAGEGQLPPGIGPFSPERTRREEEIASFVESLKTLTDERRAERVASLRAAMGGEPSWEPWMLDKYLLMSREEMCSLPEEVEIGSHTRTHPILTRVSEARARDEIEGSREILESILGRPVHSFCYPNGDFTAREVGYVRAAYRVAVNGAEDLADRRSNLHALPRIPGAKDMSSFAWRMIRPAGGG